MPAPLPPDYRRHRAAWRRLRDRATLALLAAGLTWAAVEAIVRWVWGR